MRKLFYVVLFCVPSFVIAQEEKFDLNLVQKIQQEETQRSKVMAIAFNLTDASGPRLTNSPGYTRAANYAMQKFKEWGLTNISLDPWGDFGKGWELERSYAAMTAPYYKPFIAIPKAWCKGTNGLKNAEVILITATDSTGLDAYKGKLANKIIILDRSDSYKHTFQPDAQRYTSGALETMENAVARPAQPVDTAAARRRREQLMRQGGGVASMLTTLKTMAQSEGALAILSHGRGHDGTLWVQGGGGYRATDSENFLDVVVTMEDYMPIVRLLKAGTPVKIEMDVKTRFVTNDIKGYNVIAEIKGTDSKLKDEVVMLGGHLDSWHGSTGATDNAAGCAVMMEAIRLIQATGIKPRRTIRIALWGGEEQGLHGSRGYVKKTFGDPATMQVLPAHQKFSSYFNLDNGTGKIRGIYTQGNEAVKSIFTSWLKPFSDSGSKTVTINNTGGTDHLAFDALGLPGFQFIQDEIEYDTRTHHTNMDSYDHLIEADLKHSAAVVASFVLNAAQRDQKLPRKEMPKPVEARRG